MPPGAVSDVHVYDNIGSESTNPAGLTPGAGVAVLGGLIGAYIVHAISLDCQAIMDTGVSTRHPPPCVEAGAQHDRSYTLQLGNPKAAKRKRKKRPGTGVNYVLTRMFTLRNLDGAWAK